MRLPLTDDFWQACERYGFRFCCEDCCHFDPQTERCVHGWPAEEHRQTFYRGAACREIVFCKEFELR